jgi:hypothetical protein
VRRLSFANIAKPFGHGVNYHEELFLFQLGWLRRSVANSGDRSGVMQVG